LRNITLFKKKKIFAGYNPTREEFAQGMADGRDLWNRLRPMHTDRLQETQIEINRLMAQIQHKQDEFAAHRVFLNDMGAQAERAFRDATIYGMGVIKVPTLRKKPTRKNLPSWW
jgi:hypothetical protein